jgi:TPR repeat protein
VRSRGETSARPTSQEWRSTIQRKRNRRATHRLSDYHDGYGDVAQDYAKAREWFKKAADKGLRLAGHDLFEPLSHRPRHHRHRLEWPPVLRSWARERRPRTSQQEWKCAGEPQWLVSRLRIEHRVCARHNASCNLRCNFGRTDTLAGKLNAQRGGQVASGNATGRHLSKSGNPASPRTTCWQKMRCR